LVCHLNELSEHGSAIIVCEHRSRYFDGAGAFQEYSLNGSAETIAQDALTSAPLPTVPAFRLTLNNLAVAFGQRQVLDNVCLELTGGQIIALVGVNGSGKTTLLRSLIGLQRHEGKIEVSDGSTLDLGLVYQNPDLQLFNPTVREEMLYRITVPDEGLYRWLATHLGLECYQASSPLLLSEGEKKRLCLAMVLMHQPRHGVLLDEPTLGQDDGHRALLGHTARGLAEAGRLVIVATHDLAWAAQYATHMLVLHQGQIIARGAPDVLLRDTDLWRRVGLYVPDWIWEPIE
jgi:energy-coupling factor transporter ATP-binding protein EcfA2